MNVLDAIHSRRSVRSYLPGQISEEQLNAIIEAGLWAPSARNAQEIIFVVLQDGEAIDELKSAFAEVNFGGSNNRDFTYGAPTFILLFGDKDFHFSEIDGGIAVENMALAAEGLGLGSLIIGCIHGMLTNDREKWCKKFGVPDSHKFIIAIAIGIKDSVPPKRPRKDDRIIRI